MSFDPQFARDTMLPLVAAAYQVFEMPATHLGGPRLASLAFIPWKVAVFMDGVSGTDILIIGIRRRRRPTTGAPRSRATSSVKFAARSPPRCMLKP